MTTDSGAPESAPQPHRQHQRTVPRTDRSGACRRAATPCPSGRNWWTGTASPAPTKASNAYVRKLRGTQSPEARAVIQTAPGEEAQVDYGTGPMVRDAQTGKYRRTRLFVLTLGFSRKCVRLLSLPSSARIWAELHEQAFRRLGGSDPSRGARQPQRRRAHARYLRSQRSTRSIAMCWPTTAPSPCPAEFGIRIAKAKSNPASAMRRRHR